MPTLDIKLSEYNLNVNILLLPVTYSKFKPNAILTVLVDSATCIHMCRKENGQVGGVRCNPYAHQC